MALALRTVCRGFGIGHSRPITLQGPLVMQWTRAVVTTSPVGALKPQTAEDFWAKNKRLSRPMSPHLTIYKPQITSMLSITHRGTGVALSGILSAFGIGMLFLPNSYPYYLELINNMHFGGLIIFAAKFSLALPFMFHLCNGVRHLVWDCGYGFSLRALYKSGWFVCGLSLVLSAALAAL